MSDKRVIEFDALGTRWWIEPLQKWANLEKLQGVLLQSVEEFESNYSRFKATSLITRLNGTKQIEHPSDELVEMMQYALRMNRMTDGLFNISVGAKLEQLGYGRQPTMDAHISERLEDDIHVSANLLQIADHIRIDFGGFGKGWLVDKLSSVLRDQGCDQFVVNGGGDIMVEAKTATTFYIEHPHDTHQAIGEITVMRGGLAASSAHRRQWKTKDGDQHHVIHPTEQKPVSMLASVHIFAPNALLADTLGTVFLLVDDDDRARFAQKFAVEYLAVYDDLSFFQTSRYPAKMY